ncbi:GIY-YIG nuclease family protein [Desulfobaculum bizertense]|uniref:GIY-YIG nuclease family protein n=1 Tax=Desulfobaculum bizertense TaxID=376490 RepID=UPI001F1DE09F|nr:GIY-YIG nuclease family protein [Desulfobaculum bizertense]UIJ38740.1 GIY-YIG nuclease family protein [Desulfobaculum bizertense]
MKNPLAILFFAYALMAMLFSPLLGIGYKKIKKALTKEKVKVKNLEQALNDLQKKRIQEEATVEAERLTSEVRAKKTKLEQDLQKQEKAIAETATKESIKNENIKKNILKEANAEAERIISEARAKKTKLEQDLQKQEKAITETATKESIKNENIKKNILKEANAEAERIISEARAKKTKLEQAPQKQEKTIAEIATKKSIKDEHVKKNILREANAEAERIISEARAKKEKIEQDSQNQKQKLIDKAKGWAKEIEQEAKRKAQKGETDLAEATTLLKEVKALHKETASDAQKEAHQILQDAQREKDRLLTEAASTSREIITQSNLIADKKHADILDAKSNYDLYKNTIDALTRKIEKYEHTYLYPTFNFFNQYTFSIGDAEIKNKIYATKNYIQTLIEKDLSAYCEYTDKNKCKAAKQFATQAFNWGIEPIVYRLKELSTEQIRQELTDVYCIINKLGKPFKNCKLSEIYFKAVETKLFLLKEAIIVREDELEERRILKKKLKEEEKAQKEYKETIATAQQEESFLIKKIQEAKNRLEKSNKQQRDKFEREIDELKLRLEESNNKKLRAISMAEQTRKGYVYIISNIGSFGTHTYKIGLTRRLDPFERISELSSASVPFPFDVHAIIPSDDAPALENKLHQIFAKKKINLVNKRKEFFDTSIAEIKEAVEGLGISTQWTLTAEARQYKESQHKRKLPFLDSGSLQVQKRPSPVTT